MFDLLPWMWHHNSLTDWKCAVHKSCLTHVCRSKSYHSKGATDHVLVCVSFCLPLKIHRQKVTILVVFVIRSLNTFRSVLYLAWIHLMSINWVDGDRLQIPIGLIRWFGHVVQLYWNIKREKSLYMAIPQIGSTFLSWLLLCECVHGQAMGHLHWGHDSIVWLVVNWHNETFCYWILTISCITIASSPFVFPDPRRKSTLRKRITNPTHCKLINL